MSVEATGTSAGFQFWSGALAGIDCVVARCGMGKVSAAAGVQRLIDLHAVDCFVVCGLCGGLGEDLAIGDIVVGERFIQHDVDASPIFPRFEVPGLGLTEFRTPPELVQKAASAARRFLDAGFDAVRDSASFGSEAPRVHAGLIVTGDQFIKDEGRLRLQKLFPDALCVEMEGGAVAQVCHMNALPLVVVRIVSDLADGSAPTDFVRFVEEVAPAYTVGIVSELLPRLP
jgi:adenosylhomocysteine nucleosidase